MSGETERRSAAIRTTERLRDLTSQALASDAVRSAFATKLVAAGLGLVAFAAGVDYFGGNADMERAIEDVAAGAGATGVASTVQQGGAWLAAVKAWVVAQLPDTKREVVLWLASLVGLVLLWWGLRLKLRHPDRGRAVRDLGMVLLGPGLVGALLFAITSWSGVAQIRIPARGFFEKLRAGQLGHGELWDFTVRYAPWAWHDLWPVLLLGLALLGLAVGLRPRADEPVALRPELRVARQVARRSAIWGAALALTYYAAVTLVAIVTYGAGMAALTWPWKVKPWASLATLAFMAVGGGLVRTGNVLLREAGAGPAEPGADRPTRS